MFQIRSRDGKHIIRSFWSDDADQWTTARSPIVADNNAVVSGPQKLQLHELSDWVNCPRQHA